jgi:hypothetical protein
LKYDGGKKPGDEAVKGLLDSEAYVPADAGAEYALHLGTQLQHAQEKEGDARQKEEDAMYHISYQLTAYSIQLTAKNR